MNIVFTVNNPFVKYAAVCMSSIFKNLNLQDTHLGELAQKYDNGDLNIHIFNDGLESETEKKLRDLQEDLSTIMPFNLIFHTLNDSDFKGFPFFNRYRNYLIYYRLKIAEVLPKAQRALYLDADTLVNCDIRELYTIDLDNKVLGAVKDFGAFYKERILPTKSKNGTPYDFSSHDFYFNSGVLLIDLQKWREENIEAKCLEFLRTYYTKCPDQDALNAVCKENIKEIDFAYNCMIPKNKYLLFQQDTQDKKMSLSYEKYKEVVNNPKIIHYYIKPWVTPYKYGLLDANFNPIEPPNGNLWWECAAQTKPFWSELEKIKNDIDNIPPKQIQKYIQKEKTNRWLEKQPLWYRKAREFIRHPYKVTKRAISGNPL